MAHYDCTYCGVYGCFGDCPEGVVARERTPTGPPPAPIPKPPPAPVKSDGGSSSYYTLTITNKNGESIECETGDVIRALVANDFSLGNIVKACRRVSEALQGRGKEGVDPTYDLNKIIYFAEEIKTNAIR